jgi:HTH-type transcriptional regulator/antitoxin HipB
MRVQTTQDLRFLIQSERAKKQWTQQELADRTMVGREWIVALERGKNTPRIDLVFRTLTALGLGVSISPLPDDPFDEILSQ